MSSLTAESPRQEIPQMGDLRSVAYHPQAWGVYDQRHIGASHHRARLFDTVGNDVERGKGEAIGSGTAMRGTETNHRRNGEESELSGLDTLFHQYHDHHPNSAGLWDVGTEDE